MDIILMMYSSKIFMTVKWIRLFLMLSVKGRSLTYSTTFTSSRGSRDESRSRPRVREWWGPETSELLTGRQNTLIDKQSKIKKNKMSTVFIYNGKGSGEDSRRFFYETLLDEVDPKFHNVKFISAEEIVEGQWMADAKVLCFGGGYDLGFLQSLGTTGVRQIQEFVRNGGNYLGMCAGGYFGCDSIEFDKDGPLEVVGSRDLKFYPGKCIGPAFPGFMYNSKKGVHAVPVSYRNSFTLSAYMHGGGYFLPCSCDCDDENVKVLAKYESLEQTPAALVKCKVGKGVAILSGVHFEYQALHLDKENVHLKRWMPHFLEAEKKRILVFRDILLHLGLHVKNAQKESVIFHSTL